MGVNGRWPSSRKRTLTPPRGEQIFRESEMGGKRLLAPRWKSHGLCRNPGRSWKKVLRFRIALLGLALFSVTACDRPQDRLAKEENQLIFGLKNVCLPRAFEGLSAQEIARRAALKPEKHLGYTGWFTLYRSPQSGLRPINLEIERQCYFNVGEPRATPADLSALDLALSNYLSKDSHRWHSIDEPHDLGRGWCDASNKVFVRSFESNPENPPPGIKAYIRKMQLQVRVTADNGWYCNYLSRLNQPQQTLPASPR